MGDGGRISRALTLLAALLLAGCVDLTEPNIPNLGAPAVFNITIRQLPGAPIDVGGTLSAGREASGVRRHIFSPLLVLREAITLGEPNAQGINFISRLILPPEPAFVGPFEVQGPILEGVADPPLFSWYGMRRTDPDTVFTDALGDVTLHVQTEFGAVTPPRSRQWFLELAGDAGSIRVSGDGAPPATLRIPSQFIPSAPDKQVEATLIYFQSATVAPQPGNYISSVTLDVRVQWILRLR